MSREAFDSFMRREYENMPLDRIGTGEYREWFVWRTWQAWQACRAAALEEAARKVENYCGAWDDEGYALAMEIRALKEKE